VTKLDHGPLQDLGLAEHYIVLSIDGHDVPDAATFAKLATDEYAALSTAEHGGSFHLLVQTETGDPREFSTQLAGKPAPQVPPPTGHGPHTHDVDHSNGVNVWDAYGGNKHGGRDDPTQ
jgi:hypothetical protein